MAGNGSNIAAAALTGAVRVPISQLRPGDSPRLDGEDIEHIRLLAESATELPPIIVQRSTMRVIDGMHRLRAAWLRQVEEVQVQFVECDDQDAFVFAVEANIQHGLPLSLADRSSAVERIMRSHPDWSDRAIGAVTGLSNKTVAKIRRRTSGDIPQSYARRGRDGRVRPLDSSGGRQLAGELMTSNPAASLRDISRTAGISVSTARDVRARLLRGEDVVVGQERRSARSDGTRHAGASSQPREHDGRRRLPSGDLDFILRTLRNDPAVRSTEVGRALLRMLDIHAIDPSAWEQLLTGVPTHCVGLVLKLADACAGTWHTFAEQLARREQNSG